MKSLTDQQVPVQVTPQTVADVTSGLPRKVRAVLAVISRLQKGSLRLLTPEGLDLQFSGLAPGPVAELHLRNWRLAQRAVTRGTIGVAESYMDGDWDSPDVTTFLELFTVNVEAGEAVAGSSNTILNIVQRLHHWLNENTRRGAKRNIAAHYDLGNEFYSQWLDKTMTYSSALFSTGATDLESAQNAKYAALIRDLGITAQHHVLEIGCGWGGFAEYAAREIGCHVTGLTISREQYVFATGRIAAAGLTDKVEIRFQDYRDEMGRYDRIVSIEMFEAVGERYWPDYFDALHTCLKPGGKAGLQIITIDEVGFEAYRRRPDFIQRYVFPGGMLPTPQILKKLSSDHGLFFLRERVFAQDYARTLAEWRTRFWTSWDTIKLLGFDDRFKRLWEFYLYYCEAGFRAGYIDVRQVIYRA